MSVCVCSVVGEAEAVRVGLQSSLSFQAYFAEGEALPLSEERPPTADRCLRGKHLAQELSLSNYQSDLSPFLLFGWKRHYGLALS